MKEKGLQYVEKAFATKYTDMSIYVQSQNQRNLPLTIPPSLIGIASSTVVVTRAVLAKTAMSRRPRVGPIAMVAAISR